MLLHWSKNWESVSNYMMDEGDVYEVADCNTSGISSSLLPFLDLAELSYAWLPAILMTLKFSSETSLPVTQHYSLAQVAFNIKPAPNFTSGFATPYRGWRLRWAKEKFLLSLRQRPVKAPIKVHLSRRNSVLKNCEERGPTNPRLCNAALKQNLYDMLKYKLYYQPV